MARTRRGKRKSNFAQAVPGNTMTVTLPIQDQIQLKDSAGATFDSFVVNGAYEWKTVNITDLLKRFPIKNHAGVVVPEAFKLVSVTVASSYGYPGDIAKAAASNVAVVVNPQPVGAAVKFPNGQLFEQSAESSRLMKCRPSKVPQQSWGDDAFYCGAWNRVSEALLEDQACFSYRGELKYVTIAFRLPDNVDLNTMNGLPNYN